MKKSNKAWLLAVGSLAGALMGTPATQAATEYLKATRSTQSVYVDGQKADLDAFNIEGSNYVKLKDVGKLLDVNVYWDGSAVQIDTSAPYTGEGPITMPLTPAPSSTPEAAQSYTISTNHWSREDFSWQINPAVFVGPYTRELYNTIRQTLLDAGTDRSAGTNCAYCMVSKADYGEVQRMIGRMNGVLRYEHYVPKGFTNYYEWLDYFALSAAMPENFRDAYEFIQPVIRETKKLGSDRERVIYLNDYVCSLLVYQKDSTAGISQIFAPHSEELKAACGSYANAFKFLCQAAGIPCMNVISENHAWNLAYADGEWLYVDTTNNDCIRRDYILLTPTLKNLCGNHTDKAPEATEFLKELLVPGSTK